MGTSATPNNVMVKEFSFMLKTANSLRQEFWMDVPQPVLVKVCLSHVETPRGGIIPEGGIAPDLGLQFGVSLLK